MIAVIPAAGLGTRFLPLTRVVPKEMLPIGNRPALELIVGEARQAGASKIVIILSERKELIREYFRDQPDVSFVYQKEQRGLGHAVLQVEGEVRSGSSETSGTRCPHRVEEDILILLGDALVSGCPAAAEMAALSREAGGASVIGCERVPPEKVERYGILKVRRTCEKGRTVEKIEDLVEKPSRAEAPSDLAIAGRYLLSSEIFAYLRTQTPGKGGEIQLTDAIRRMIVEGGRECLAYVYPGRRHDIGNPRGYFETLQAFMSTGDFDIMASS